LENIRYTLPQGWTAEIRDGGLSITPISGGGEFFIKVYNYSENVGRREYYCQLVDYCIAKTTFTSVNIGNIAGYKASVLDNSGGGAEYFGAKGNKFYIITSYNPPAPNEFEKTNSLFETKFTELFGRQIARDVKTYEQLKHAITIVPSKTELCIKFSDTGEDIYFNGDVIKIPLPKKCGPAAMMAIGYYVIGKIQEQHKQYFKDNITQYVRKVSSKPFGEGIKVIVE